ncbi:hypothetical protein [Acinetobacter sp.]|uniref:hypothetical protein n=1 Tax=Acinetobacter sp. TaxID=472 RepID=UPI003752F1B1
MALVAEYANKLKPWNKRGDTLIEVIPIAGCDPFSGSFLRHYREGDEYIMPDDVIKLDEFYTLHTFVLQSVFHPSMEEVIAQIPRAYLEDIVGFTLEWAAVMPEPLHSQLLAAKMHLGKLTIYGYTDIPVEEKSEDLIAVRDEIEGKVTE